VGLTVCELSQRIYKKKITRRFIHITVQICARNGMELNECCEVLRLSELYDYTLSKNSVSGDAKVERRQHFAVLCTCRFIITDNGKVGRIGKGLKLHLTTYRSF